MLYTHKFGLANIFCLAEIHIQIIIIITAWGEYHKDLATPARADNSTLQRRVVTDCLREIYREGTDTEVFTLLEITSAIKALNTNRAADLSNMSAEHLSGAPLEIVDSLLIAFNEISKHLKCPH